MEGAFITGGQFGRPRHTNLPAPSSAAWAKAAVQPPLNGTTICCAEARAINAPSSRLKSASTQISDLE